jgi:hypothetical protein
MHLTEMAYEWCSVMCESYSHLADWEDLLLLSLEIGFRYLKPQLDWTGPKLNHTTHNQQMVEIVFGSGNAEAIADLLQAWTLGNRLRWPQSLLQMCARHFTQLHNLQPFSPRLQKLVIRSIEFLGYQAFDQVGMEGFIGLLNNLHVGMDDTGGWAGLLLETIQSSEEVCHLSYPHWEFLVEYIASGIWWLSHGIYSPHTTTLLEEAGEWNKLKCWMGVVWILWPPGDDRTMEEDLKRVTLLLFHQQPGAVQKLEQWVGQWCEIQRKVVPKPFQLICEQACAEMAQQDIL